MRDRQDIARIANHYGAPGQGNQAIQECAELIHAITEINRRGADLGSIHHMAEEIADVEIMLDQLKYLHQCETEANRYRSAKIARQLTRIAAEKGKA